MANTESSTERWREKNNNKDLHPLPNKWCGRGREKRRAKQWGRKEGAGQTTDSYGMQQGKTSQTRYRKDLLLLILFLPTVVLIYYHPITSHPNLVSIDLNTVHRVSSQRKYLDLKTTNSIILRKQTVHDVLFFVHLHKLTSTNVIMSHLKWNTFSQLGFNYILYMQKLSVEMCQHWGLLQCKCNIWQITWLHPYCPEQETIIFNICNYG